ncbi:YitT family protein [Acidaminobacterium chupaoyuni]
MKKINWKKILIKYLCISVGSVFYAASVALLLDPNGLAPGGVVGISIILNRVIGIPTGTMMFCINIPLLILGVWKFGARFFISTIYTTVFSSFLVDFMSPHGALTTDPLLASVFGSVCMAVGVAMVFKAGATTGGTDILVRLLRLKYKHIESGKLFFMTDLIIVSTSMVVYADINTGLYALLTIVVFAAVFDVILYGSDTAKMVFVISDHEEAIADKIMEKLEIGVTYVQGEGAYTGKAKRVILCVAKKQLFPKIKEIVKEEDAQAFMIVSSASDIYGEGFKDHFAEEF